MTTEEMRNDILKTYTTYKHLFDLARIEDVQFYKWLHSAQLHSEVRKCAAFMHGTSESHVFTPKSMLRPLMKAQECYKNFTPEAWKNLMIINKSNPAVKLLKSCIHDVCICWYNRPKFRKGSD